MLRIWACLGAQKGDLFDEIVCVNENKHLTLL